MSHSAIRRAVRCAGAAALALTVTAPATALAASRSSRSSGGGSAGPAAGRASGGAGYGTNPAGAAADGGTSPSATAGSGRPRGRVLREGMRGRAVRVLQQELSFAGFPTAIDGDFGPQTRRSVIDFQRSEGMRPTGVVTLAVRRSLRRAVAAVEATPALGRTRINPDGTATAPAGAPAAVLALVAAANSIIDTSYCVGGGHGSWRSTCYDCSGSVSFALHGAGLLRTPEDSTQLESYGAPGPGRWISVYADPGHAFIVVAGRAFDTADYGGPNIPSGTGPRWRSDPTGNLADGGDYVVRHPPGL